MYSSVGYSSVTCIQSKTTLFQSKNIFCFVVVAFSTFSKLKRLRKSLCVCVCVLWGGGGGGSVQFIMYNDILMSCTDKSS